MDIEELKAKLAKAELELAEAAKMNEEMKKAIEGMIQSAMMAHINEHVAFEYRRQMEQQMGMILPSEDNQKHMTSEQADQIAMAAAQASQQLLQQNKQQAAQQAAQQQMQDPVVQMQMQEIQIKQGELKLKEQKLQMDAAAKADQIEIEKSRIESQKEIAAMQVGATAAAAKDRIEKQQELEGARMGIDMAKHKAQMANNRAQQAQNRTPRTKGE